MWAPNFGEALFISPVLRRIPATLRLNLTQCLTVLVHKEMITTETPQSILIQPATIVGISSTRWNLLRSWQPPIMRICPPTNQTSSLFYINALVSDSNAEIQFYLSIDSSEWNARTIPLSQLPPWSGEEVLQGLVRIVCGSTTFLCEPGSADLGTSCAEFWVSMPRKDGNPLWPIPRMFLDTQLSGVQYVDEYHNGSSLLYSNQLRMSLLLEYYFKTQSQITLPDWSHTLNQCVLTFYTWSLITTRNGEFQMNNLSLPKNPRVTNCSSSDFIQLSHEIDRLTDLLLKADDLGERLTLRYRMDILTFFDTWQICDTQIQGLLDKDEKMAVFETTSLCNSDMMRNASLRKDDACCNDTLGWSKCCVPRQVTTMKQSLKLKNNTSLATSDFQCQSQACVQELLTDYIFYNEVVNSVQGCGAVVTQTLEYAKYSNMEFYRRCKVESFGNDFEGKNCSEDSDCSISHLCDTIKQKCVFSTFEQRNESYYEFFRCLVKDMPYSLEDALISQFLPSKEKLEVTSEELVQVLYENFTSQACVTEFARSRDGYHYMMTSAIGVATCGIDDWSCLDWSCPIPLRSETGQQFGRVSSTCKRIKGHAGSPTCEEWVCNWNPTIVDDERNENSRARCENQTTTGFCAVCDSQSTCIEIKELSEAECGARPICINGKGGYNLSIDNEQDCKDWFGSCSLPCSEQPCTRTGCAQAGYCTDRNIKPYLTIVNPNVTGYCVSDMRAWNSPDCNRAIGQTTINSIILGSDFPLDSQCYRTQNSTNCIKYASYGYRWYEFATNQTACEKFNTCSEPNYIHTSLTTTKNTEECSKCTGTPKATFEWIEGKWQEGVFRSAQWKQREYINVVSNDLAINFADLDQFFVGVVTQDYALQLVTEVQCRLNPTKEVMEKVLCACENGVEHCSDLNQASVTVGVGRVCPQTEAIFVAPPSKMTFLTNSTKGCVDLVGYSRLQQDLKASHTSRLSMSFRKNVKTQRNIWNTHGATIGNTAGNGILLELTPADAELESVTICLTFQTLSEIDYSEYPEYDLDFGVRSGDKVYPMQVKLEAQDSLYCARNLKINSEMNEFYPIVRETDWENQEETQTYSLSQKAVYSVVLILYFILLCGLVFYQISAGISVQSHRLFDLFLISAVLVRCLYFLLLLILHPTSQESVAEFLGVEFPTFAYLSTVSLGVMIWALVKSSRMDKDKTFNPLVVKRLTFVLNVLLYILLIIVTILFFEMEENSSMSCFNKMYTEPSTTSHDILRIVYVSIISAATVGLVVLIFYYGGSVAITFKLMKTTGDGSRKLKGWLGVTMVMAMSVLLQCIFMLVYSLALTPSYEYSLVLILIEIIPIGFVLYLQMSIHSNDHSKRSSNKDDTIVPDQFTSKEASKS
eukprot:TRINITY_DN2998_c0_g1_i1.p1 TRINITY_DN2998_c0_g1~~TRINITY_DN2998_c0_g1_i1.p1  ORF type:complete len:1596 (-),score=278.78 TRINITY_DN2998_c0_g1_i1:132-4262(-)